MSVVFHFSLQFNFSYAFLVLFASSSSYLRSYLRLIILDLILLHILSVIPVSSIWLFLPSPSSVPPLRHSFSVP